jgi:hypothetical protein
MNIIHFNLNDQVKVKLTKTGRKYLKQKNVKLATDKEGFLTLSLQEFAGIFGDALQLPTFNPPVEPNIILIVDQELTSKSPNQVKAEKP